MFDTGRGPYSSKWFLERIVKSKISVIEFYKILRDLNIIDFQNWPQESILGKYMECEVGSFGRNSAYIPRITEEGIEFFKKILDDRGLLDPNLKRRKRAPKPKKDPNEGYYYFG
jgi:hypothetical protein